MKSKTSPEYYEIYANEIAKNYPSLTRTEKLVISDLESEIINQLEQSRAKLKSSKDNTEEHRAEVEKQETYFDAIESMLLNMKPVLPKSFYSTNLALISIWESIFQDETEE